MSEVGSIYVSVMPTTDGLTRQMNRQLGGGFTQAAATGERTFGQMFRRVALAGAAILATLGIGKLIKDTITLGINYNTLEQTSRAAFTTILGGADEAAQMMSNLRDFVKGSPFPRQSYITAAQQMAAFGIESQKVIPYLDAVTDAVAAAGGQAQQLEEITFVMSQIQAAGKITGIDLIQFGQRGIDAATLIGSQMGKTGAEIREEITKGTLGATEALDALAAGMKEKFDGAADNVRNTWYGATDAMKGAWRDLSSAIMEPFVSKEGGGLFVGIANDFADFIWSLVPIVEPFMVNLGEMLASFSGSGLGEVMRYLSPIGAAFKILGPVVRDLQEPISVLLGVFGEMAQAVLPILMTAFTEMSTIISAVLAVALPVLVELFTAIAEAINGILPALSPLLSLLGDALISVFETLWPIIEDLVDLFIELLDPIMQIVDAAMQLLEPLIGLIGPLADLVLMFLPPLIDLLKVLLPPIMDVVTAIADWLVPVVGFLLDALDGLINFIVGVFTGDWERAWSGIGNFFIGIWNAIISFLEGAVNSIVDLVNMIIGGVNSVTGTMGIPEIPLMAKVSFSGLQVPKLAASGTILPRPGGTLILAAEAGRAESVVDTGKLNELMDAASRGPRGEVAIYTQQVDEQVLAALVAQRMRYS